MTYLDTIRRHYPQARSTSETVDQLMAADSICSDDLNSIE
jgi:hypothetical protein